MLLHYKKAMVINEKNNDDVNLTMDYSNLGRLFQDMGKESGAQEYFEKSSKIKKRLGL
jgi:hypothetical protein